jgi:hypothetical protein
LTTPPSTGDTSDPGIVASFSGSGSGDPLGRMFFAQLVVSPYFAVTTCSPVTRSTVKK